MTSVQIPIVQILVCLLLISKANLQLKKKEMLLKSFEELKCA